MEINYLRTLLVLVCLSIFSTAKAADPSQTSTDNYVPTYEEGLVKSRLNAMSCLVQPKYTSVVKGYLTGYLVRDRAKAERIMGRAVLYFPLFEKMLKENNMPDDIKYLSVVESALRPNAVSRVGAGGLWQFMPATAAEYNLNIDRYCDDRCDPEASTQAAIEYLQRSYARYNSWELALAAYNSGGGRVNRAVRRARSKNFWKVMRYLPRETRNYVPAFIAATYLGKHYQDHEIQPLYPSLDMQMTQSIEVYEYLSFIKIQEVTSLPRWVIEDLNPRFRKGFIPSNNKGYKLTLPRRVMPSMNDYFKLNQPDTNPIDIEQSATSLYVNTPQKAPIEYYYETSYYVNEGDTLEKLAEIFGCTTRSIMAWNRMSWTALLPGEELKIYQPRKYEHWRPNKVEEVEQLPTISMQKPLKYRPTIVNLSVPERGNKKSLEELTSVRGKYIYYRVQQYETLTDIADKFPGVRLEDIVELNNFKPNKLPKAGDKIKIKMMN